MPPLFQKSIVTDSVPLSATDSVFAWLVTEIEPAAGRISAVTSDDVPAMVSVTVSHSSPPKH